MIDVEELIKEFKDLGVEVDRTEAMKLLQRYCHSHVQSDTSHSLSHMCALAMARKALFHVTSVMLFF
jgi:hypothetical protein